MVFSKRIYPIVVAMTRSTSFAEAIGKYPTPWVELNYVKVHLLFNIKKLWENYDKMSRKTRHTNVNKVYTEAWPCHQMTAYDQLFEFVIGDSLV